MQLLLLLNYVRLGLGIKLSLVKTSNLIDLVIQTFQGARLGESCKVQSMRSGMGKDQL